MRNCLRSEDIHKDMSPALSNGTANGHLTNDLNLSILALGVEYPPYRVGPDALQTIAERYYPESPAYVEPSSTTSISFSSSLLKCPLPAMLLLTLPVA